ncbi:MAG: 30S ribosomal protein S2 [Candidatus Micrarchaeota archaeon]|nr:30S ribosomal protein S2 [Candidatus Micrarchaeota archaeon]
MVSDKANLLVKQEMYLEAGIHIGTKMRTYDMRNYVFKRRDDGLFILDLRKTDEKILKAAKIISKFKPEDVLVVASRAYSGNPASKFSLLTGIPIIKGRFIPGTMTNLAYTGFREPKILFICDPKGEREAISESAKNGVPVIALCDTDNETRFIDLVVPVNNKGKRSLALIFYILAREVMLSQGKIASYDEFTHDLAFFENSDAEGEGPSKITTKSILKKSKPEPESKESAVQHRKETPKEVSKEEPKTEKKE